MQYAVVSMYEGVQLNGVGRRPVEWAAPIAAISDEYNIKVTVRRRYFVYSRDLRRGAQARKRVRMLADVLLMRSRSMATSSMLTSAMSAMRYATSPFESENCFSTL